jgi:acetylornithine/succinyldiaminopimelate/putrescine aminotransferase
MYTGIDYSESAMQRCDNPVHDCRYVMQTYARPNLVFVRGEGARLYDAHDKEYLDFAAGIAVNALGANQFTTWVV